MGERTIFQRYNCGSSLRMQDILSAVSSDGVCVLENALPKGDMLALRDEIFALSALREGWLNHHREKDGFLFSYSPLVARKLGEDKKTVQLSAAFGAPHFVQIAQQYLGRMWYVDRIILDLSIARPEPITAWHADQFKNNERCLKFMIYLGDTTAKNGAFSYVPGSHRLMHHLSGRYSRDNRELHTIDDIRERAHGLGDSTTLDLLHGMEAHIRSAELSDDYYSVEAPAGTCVIFDANGVHRGGVISEGERLLTRSHCKVLDYRAALTSFKDAANLAERFWLRCISEPSTARLI